MSYFDIRSALTKSIKDLNTGLPIAYENTKFKSRDYDAFLDLNLLMDEQTPIDKTGLDIVEGIYQITIYVKRDTSTLAMDNATDTILGYYIHNLKLTSNAQTVVITKARSTGGRNEDGWYKNDISIYFKSDILR